MRVLRRVAELISEDVGNESQNGHGDERVIGV